MPCYHPIPAYQDQPGMPVRLYPPLGTATMSLPCGTCLGCRTARAVEWSRRCTHEAKRWRFNSFVTLTYGDEHVPENSWLEPDELCKFFKRLRQAVARSGSVFHRTGGAPVRYFACGEYGERTGRPHYHALLFNLGFGDRKPIGKDLWTSEALGRVWKFGNHSIGEVTPASATYVAMYSLKKIGCDADGVVRPRPFLRVSLKPAIGAGFVDEFGSDLAQGYLVADGKPGRIPRAYLQRLKKNDPSLAESVEYRTWLHRVARGAVDAERLVDAEKIHLRRKELLECRSSL